MVPLMEIRRLCELIHVEEMRDDRAAHDKQVGPFEPPVELLSQTHGTYHGEVARTAGADADLTGQRRPTQTRRKG
jgi:hypothetical protein